MLLYWKGNGIKIVPVVATRMFPVGARGKTEADEAAELERLELVGQVGKEQITLLTGNNEISEAEWKVIKPLLTHELEEQRLQIISISVPSKGEDGERKKIRASSIVDVPAKTAIKLIASTANPHTLQLWEQLETRDEVRVALMKRMEETGVVKAESKVEANEDEAEIEYEDSDTDEEPTEKNSIKAGAPAKTPKTPKAKE